MVQINLTADYSDDEVYIVCLGMTSLTLCENRELKMAAITPDLVN